MEKSYDVVVVGAGLAGLSAAALLASRENKKVLVIEKEDHVSGRCVSFTGTDSGIALQDRVLNTEQFKAKLAAAHSFVARSSPELSQLIENGYCSGYSFEAGGHATFWGNKGKLAYLMNYLDKNVDLPGNEGFAVIDPKVDKIFPLTPGGKYCWMSSEENKQAKALLMEMATATPEQIKEWSYISFGQWLHERTQSQKVYEFLAAIASIHMVMGEPYMIPAGDFIQFMSTATQIGMNLIKGSTGIVPKPGFIRIGERLAEAVEENGGEIMTGTRAEKVLIQGERVTGIKISTPAGEMEINTGRVICTAPPKSMFNFIPGENLPQSFVENIKENFWSPGMITGYVGLNSDIIANAGLNPKSWLLIPAYIKSGEGFIGDVDDISIMTSSFSPSLSPKGKHLFAFSIALTEKEILDETKVQKVIDGALEHIEKAFPSWKKAVEWYIFTASPTGFGDWPPVGETRPPVKSPWIEGLYFAGDGYGEDIRGSGMDAAVHSAISCVDILSGKNYSGEVLPDFHRIPLNK